MLLSLLGGALYAAWVTRRFGVHGSARQYLYVVPIVVPFASFLLDRIEHIHRLRVAGVAIDVLVAGMSMMRAVGAVPFVSGHTLFLTYAIAGPASRVTQITAALVMFETIYLKYFVWHDPISSTAGIVLGTIAALLARKVGSRREEDLPVAS